MLNCNLLSLRKTSTYSALPLLIFLNVVIITYLYEHSHPKMLYIFCILKKVTFIYFTLSFYTIPYFSIHHNKIINILYIPKKKKKNAKPKQHIIIYLWEE